MYAFRMVFFRKKCCQWTFAFFPILSYRSFTVFVSPSFPMIITLPPPRGHLHFFGSQVSQKRKGKGGVACVFLCDHPVLFSLPPLKPISLKGEEERERLHWEGRGAGTLFFVLLFVTRGRILLNFIDLFAGNSECAENILRGFWACCVQLYIRTHVSFREHVFEFASSKEDIFIQGGKA